MLIDAIPVEWRLKLKKQQLAKIKPHDEGIYVKLKQISKPVELSKARKFYWLLKYQNKEKPNCMQKWLEKNSYTFTEIAWNLYSPFHLKQPQTQN